MEAFQERLNQLISSNANKIADWSFPLSETLEQYNEGLIEQSTNLNYSETALIIQNATNVLGKRIDRLHSDASGLRNSLNDHEIQNEAAKSSKPRQKAQYNRLDLDDIKQPDLQKEMSKNCFLKKKKNNKKIKLLSQRYPQLENMCRHKFSLDVIDTLGEKIGKKYDFRCNQQLTSSHMLVDELSPEDLENHNLRSTGINEASAISRSLQLNSPGSSNLSPIGINEEAQETSDLEADDFCDSHEPDPSQESGYCTLTDLSMTREHDSSQNLTPPTDDDFLEEEPAVSHSSEFQEDPPRMETPPEDDFALPENQNQLEKSEESAQKDQTSDKKRNRESVDTDAGYTSGSPDDIQSPEPLRRSKRPRKSTDEKKSKTFQAIPFDAPIPERIPKARSEFKLPCHISLLKNSRTPRKRRANRDSVKKEKLTKFLMNETENRNKLLMYSPSRPLFGSLKRETDEFQKVFEERFKNRVDISICRFDAILNNNDELRGFSPRMSSSILNSEESIKPAVMTSAEEPGNMVSSKIIDDRLQEIQEASCSYTPPHSPDFPGDYPGDSDEDDVDDRLTKSLSHQERIEKRMKELQREFDVRNDREDETARWLEAMETLRAAERRPVFNVRNYEERIVNRLMEENEMAFEDIAIEEEPEDIARLFVASLHLANTYTVNITPSDDTSTLNLSLINSGRSQKI